MPAHPLHDAPLWREEDVGKPVPNDPNANSGVLGTGWQVEAYERGELLLPIGYPRFVDHPDVVRLNTYFAQKTGTPLRVFASERTAERAAQYSGGKHDERDGFHFVVTPDEETAKKAKAAWQHAGAIVSSRRAADFMSGATLPASAAHDAKQTLRVRIAELSGAAPEDVFLTGTGMEAVALAHSIVQDRMPDQATMQAGFPYVDTLKLQSHFGNCAYVEYNGVKSMLGVHDAMERHLIAGVFCEVPGNPLLRTVDMQRLKARAGANDVPLVADDTIATWRNIDLTQTADITVTSLSKFFSGMGNVMGGAVVLHKASRYHDQFAAIAGRLYEDNFYAADAIVMENNSRRFNERMNIINQRGLEVAEFLSRHPRVGEVWYPGLKSNKDSKAAYDTIKREGGGYSGLMSFVLKDQSKTADVHDAMEITKAPGLGNEFTSVCLYTLLAHYHELPVVERQGISRNLMRVSVGTENPGVVVERLDRALRHG